MPDLDIVAALGCAIRIDASGRTPDEVAQIRRAWADAAVRPTDDVPARHRTVVVGDGPIPQALAALSQTVTHAAIEERRGDLWMLHAGAVADEQGRVVAVVGPSGRGKTTATRALGRVFGYVTDETLGVAPDGAVLPHRKPLSIIEDALRDKVQRSPGELGLRALPDAPLRLCAVVLLDRDPGAGDEPTLEPCALGDALPELVEQTSFLADLDAPLRTIAALVAATGGVHRVTYREADTLPAALARLFRDPAEVAPVAPAARSTRDTSAAPVAPADHDGWFRAGFLDAIDLAGRDRVALLQPEVPRRATLRILDGIGPVLWRAAAGTPGDDLAALTRAVVERHGAPPTGDAEAAVAAALVALAGDGVLTREASWRVRDDVAWTGEDDRFVALALSRRGSPEPVALEGTAGVIWDVLVSARGATMTAIADAVAERADADADGIRADVAGFVGSLVEHDLARRHTP